MAKANHARPRMPQQHAPAPVPWIALGAAVLALVVAAVWWFSVGGSSGAGATNVIGSQVSSNPTDTDIAGLRAAEAGTVGRPVLVWFHADW